MRNESFRDILAHFLEEKTPIPPRENQSSQTLHTRPIGATHEKLEFFTWKTPDFSAQRPFPYRIHAKPRPRERQKPLTETILPPEVLHASERLTTQEREFLMILKGLGGEGLDGGISTARLKKAYRTLAKRLHPDRSPHADATHFRRLQSAYEGLNKALERLEKAK